MTAVGVAAVNHGTNNLHICDASYNCSGTTYDYAPTTPGTYSIQFVGSWQSGSAQGVYYGPSLSYTVACPAATPTWNGSSCTAPPVNGQCGAAYQACSMGTLGASAIYQYDANPQAQWWCNGANGGTSTLCVEYSTCGSANGITYPYTSTSYSPYAQCPSGSATDNTTFPPLGGRAVWLCQLQDSSALYSKMCQSWRDAAPASTPPPASCPADTPYTDSNQAAIANYCQANGVMCGAGYTYNNLTCHTGGVGTWTNFGPSCTAPYCTGCGCTAVATTPTTPAPPPATPPTCSATSISGCSLPTASSGSAGSCSFGYTGTCSYSCTNGTWTPNWNSCTLAPVVPGAPSGSITSNSCTISSGGSSCSMNVGWSSSNTTGTVTVQRGYSPYGTIATGPSGNQSFTFSPANTYTLNLYDGGTLIGSGSFVASCVSGTSWDATSGTCSSLIAPPLPPSCSSTTLLGCSVPSSTCSSGYTGTCNYSCVGGGWSKNWNTCVLAPAAPAPCPTTTINGCSLTNGSSGSCSAGYSGSCNYSCNNGAWTQNSNSCALPPPISNVSLTATPSVINSGQTSTLTWTSTNNAVRCDSPDFATGSLANNSNPGVTVNPTTNKTYSIYCTNPAGVVGPQSSASVTVLVPVASISVDRPRVSAGGTATISWSASGVASCVVKGPSGTIASGASNGSYNFSVGSPYSPHITTKSVYTITCQTLGAPISKSVTVNVVPAFKEF